MLPVMRSILFSIGHKRPSTFWTVALLSTTGCYASHGVLPPATTLRGEERPRRSLAFKVE